MHADALADACMLNLACTQLPLNTVPLACLYTRYIAS